MVIAGHERNSTLCEDVKRLLHNAVRPFLLRSRGFECGWLSQWSWWGRNDFNDMQKFMALWNFIEHLLRRYFLLPPYSYLCYVHS